MDKSALEKILVKNNIPAFRYFSSIGSTNSEAVDWIAAKPDEYAVVVADAQTAGRGRQGRKWITTPGASIAISVIIYPSRIEQEKPGLFSLLGGLAVQKTIEQQFDIPAEIKWPNDVLIRRRKTAGILVESVWQGKKICGIALGIGINLQQESVPPDEDLLFPATCVQENTELRVDQLAFIDDLLQSIFSLRSFMLTDKFLAAYKRKLAFLQEEIYLRISASQMEKGTLAGIDAHGNLILIKPRGISKTFPVGDVSLRQV